MFRSAILRSARERLVPPSVQNLPEEGVSGRSSTPPSFDVDLDNLPASASKSGSLGKLKFSGFGPQQKTTMVTISEVKGNSRENRTAAHTHIKGLGLKSNGYAETSGAGFVGQVAAREVCSFKLHLKGPLSSNRANRMSNIRLAVSWSTS